MGCQEVVMYIGDSLVAYSDWVKKGPGIRYLYSPRSDLYCADSGTPEVLGAMPLQYRNNELVFFLTAMGLWEYPWQYPDFKLPDSLRVLTHENRHHSHRKRVFISKVQSRSEIIFSNNDVYSDVTLSVENTLDVKLCEIFSITYPVISNNSEFFKLEDERERLKMILSSDTFVISADSNALLFTSIESYAQDFIPDNSISDEITYTFPSTDIEQDLFFTLARIKNVNISLVVFAAKFPSIKATNFASFVRFFALAKRENEQRLLAWLEKTLKHYIK
jgi:hypothetical protein